MQSEEQLPPDPRAFRRRLYCICRSVLDVAVIVIIVVLSCHWTSDPKAGDQAAAEDQAQVTREDQP